LIATRPARSLRATRSARAPSVVQTFAMRPKSQSFAMRTASSSSSKVITPRTGPKTSSRAMVMFEVTPSNTVGR